MMDERLEQADKMLLLATAQFEKDPHGAISLARVTACAQIATAMYLREMLDRSTHEIDLNDDDGPPSNTPW